MSDLQAGPTAANRRSLAPDLARGFMLLFIALANSHYFLRATDVLGGYPQDGSTLDSATTWFIATFVDGRAFPMFGLLFGYGAAQIYRRQVESGARWRWIRNLLWRRSLFLFALGFLHAMLLYVGDILAAYGVLLFVGVWALRWRDRTLLVVAGVFFALSLMPSGDSMTISHDGPDPSMLPLDLWSALGDRLPVQPVIAFLAPLGFVLPFLVGIWAGRRRILERAGEHLVLLRWTAGLGIGAAVAGAMPVSLMLAGATGEPTGSALDWYGTLHDSLGVLGGFGYAALIALIARRREGKESPVVRAIAATGQRSLSCYLAQSVVWTVAFTPYLLDLSGTLTVTTTALLAVAAWAGTVWLAEMMRRAGYRGPFEIALRRFSYGKQLKVAHSETLS